MKLTEAYKQKAEAKLTEIQADLDKLRAKAQETDANTKIMLNEKIQKLQEEKEKLASQYKELKTSTSNAFDTLKSGFETAWNDLSQSVSQAKKDFNTKE